MFKYLASIVFLSISLCSYAKPAKIQPLPNIDGRNLYWAPVIPDEPDKWGRQTAFVFEPADSSEIRDQYDLYVLECGQEHYLYYERPAMNHDLPSLYSIPIEENKIALYLYKELCPF